MYILQERPDERAILDNGSEVLPVATLRDGYGGVSHIIVDDGCFVLLNQNARGRFSMVSHWYREAVDALKRLPDGLLSKTRSLPLSGG